MNSTNLYNELSKIIPELKSVKPVRLELILEDKVATLKLELPVVNTRENKTAEYTYKLRKEKTSTIKTYDIWSEGYRATGEGSDALFHGKAEGKDFLEACENFFIKGRSEPDPQFRIKKGNVPTYWGCRIYDNEQDARRAFG